MRLVIGSVVAAIALFFWGFVYWTKLPFSGQVMKAMPGQESYMEQVKSAVTETGVYLIPGGDEVLTEAAAAERFREGPIATVIYRREGSEPMPPTTFVYGFLHMLVSALIAGIVVMTSGRRTFFGRVMLIFWIGLFTAVWTEISDVVWYYFPWNYCLLKMGYHVSACLILAIVLGAILQPAAEPALD